MNYLATKLQPQRPTTVVNSLLALALLSFMNPALAIKKCKDAEGNWHYGDTAGVACADSKITTLNDRGFVTNQDAAPKTSEELASEKQLRDQELAEKEQREAKIAERERVLNIYESEADIDRQRDNQLNSVQGNIAVHEAYLRSMESRIARFEEDMAETKSAKKKKNIREEIAMAKNRVNDSKIELASLEQKKVKITEKFSKEREVYLAYKQKN